VKKKSPPYAIIGAVLVGIIGIFLLIKWKQGIDANSAAALDAKTKELQSQIDDLKTKNSAPVVQTDTNMRKVYYATQPVEAGAKISPAFYEEKLTPNDVLPDAYSDGTDLVGFYAIRPIEKGDPLSPHNVGKTLPFMAERIPVGMRAMAVPIFNSMLSPIGGNDTGGFVVDGDWVDLLNTLSVKNPEGGDDLLVNTQTILQNVQVLYIPQTQTRSDLTVGVTPTEPRAVTFLVTPEEAQILTYLLQAKEGHFSMILRGRSDKNVNKLKPYNITSLDDFKKVQKKTDASYARVDALQKAIEEAEQKEKAQTSKGSTNETTPPTPPPAP
jgi:Flp pilus assembly protein CpaB